MNCQTLFSETNKKNKSKSGPNDHENLCSEQQVISQRYQVQVLLTLAMMNKLRCYSHFYVSANQIT